MLSEVTPLILTFNEAPNLRRTLSRLAWAKEILVLDSFSRDGTLDIARSFPQARVVQREFKSFADQCNYGVQLIHSEWVLSMDADYLLSDAVIMELNRLCPSSDISGYRVGFQYIICGHPLRASLYPPRIVLYRKSRAYYEDDGHGHRVRIDGKILELDGLIAHDDRKPLERWLKEQNKYAWLEAKKLLGTSNRKLAWVDRLRKKSIFAPWLVCLYVLFRKGLILDGWPGIYYSFQRTYAELLLALRIMELRLTGQANLSELPSPVPSELPSQVDADLLPMPESGSIMRAEK